MSRIKILSENVSNRIAAGEVIERPASVVKELVENAIDAGATAITVTIERAGSRLISVADNGAGMDQDDALLCLEPHATSKISKEDDINSILSFGFRGEAIPSIGSVSRFTLRTRQQQSMEGTEVIVHGGKFIKSAPLGCAPGTEIIVRDLFFNTPARKKFLRTQATEEKHIQETLYLLALPYPQVGFELIMDTRKVFSSPAHHDLLPRLQTFFGKSIGEQMLPVSYSEAGISVSGYVARHGITRNTRREQRVFVNGRPVDALPVYRGIKEGYGSLVEKGRFPATVLFIAMDPLLVDVNVHPAKREVRFRREHLIVNAVRTAIQMVLRQSTAPTATVDPALSLKSVLHGAQVGYRMHADEPELGLPSAPSEQSFNRGMPTPSFRRPISPGVAKPETSTTESPEPPNEAQDTLDLMPAETPESKDIQGIEEQQSEDIRPGSEPSFPGGGPMTLIGFLDETYIIATAETGLLIIDQHAAHERVMYERILSGAGAEIRSQQLLFPITLELSRAETIFVEKHFQIFQELGFEVESFGQDTVLVSAIPAAMAQDNAGGLVRDIISDLMEKGEANRKLDTDTIARAACRAAVKAHDHLSMGEAQNLMQQMSECELPFSCPHGRPTVINISRKELEKRFGRR